MPAAKKPATQKPRAKKTVEAATPKARMVKIHVKQSELAEIRASYDAAAYTTANQNKWAHTDGLSANEANTLEVRRTIWQRARYESDNNSFLKGIIRTVSKDTVGRGPRLQMSARGDNYKALEKDWKEWCREIKYAKRLRLARAGKMKDGEGILMKVSKKSLKSPVKLYLQSFEPDQISSHFNLKTDVDGVWLDEFGEPRSYNLLEHHPGSKHGYIGKGREVPADRIIIYGNMERAGQVRGVSELAPCLELFANLRAFSLSVLAASETAANHAGLLYTDSSADALADEVDPYYEVEIERNTLKALPFGWKMSQLKAEQPVTTYKEYRDSVLNEICRCVEAPFNIALGNSSGYSYAGGRLDEVNYTKALNIERDELDLIVNDDVLDAFVDEWLAVKGIPSESFDRSHNWVYDGREHIDPVKYRNSQKVALENGTSSLQMECAKDGTDWEVVQDQRLEAEAREMKKRKEMGLPPAGAAAPGEPVDDSNEQQQEEEGNA